MRVYRIIFVTRLGMVRLLRDFSTVISNNIILFQFIGKYAIILTAYFPFFCGSAGGQPVISLGGRDFMRLRR